MNFADAQQRAPIAVALVRTLIVGVLVTAIFFVAEIHAVVVSTLGMLATTLLLRMGVVPAAAEHKMHDQQCGNQIR
jgi:hypothetical protein